MTVAMRVVLAFLPMAIYCLVMGRWQSGNHPRVVSGPRDFALLAFGLGGVLVFGPAGDFFVPLLFSFTNFEADSRRITGWIALASLVGVIAMLLSLPSRSRLVIYHVQAAELMAALQVALEQVAGPMTRSLQGYENASGRRGVTVEYGPMLRCAVVEAHGDQPHELVEAIYPRLVRELNRLPARSNPTAMVWFVLAGLVAVAVLLILLAFR